MPHEKTLTITEAARLLGITRAAVYQKLAWGRMRATKNRFGIYEIPEAELAKFTPKTKEEK